MKRSEKIERAACAPEGHKMCGTCLEFLPLSNFSVNRSRPDGLQRACKECNKVSNKKYRELHPDWYKVWTKENPERVRVIVKRYDSKLPPAIYKITNTVTGRVYIGQTKYPHRRKVDWTTNLRRGTPTKMVQGQLLEDIQKYGGDKFTFDFIEFFGRDVSKEKLLEREVYWMKEFSKSNNLYNRNGLKRDI